MGTNYLVEPATFMFWVNQFLNKITWHRIQAHLNLDTQSHENLKLQSISQSVSCTQRSSTYFKVPLFKANTTE
jgi:hypothetical protein